MARSFAGYAAAVLLAVAASGCGAESSSTTTTVRILVRDINIREEGVDCAGTGPYTYFHNRAPFRLLDGDGETLADGKLPPGKAVRTFEEDLEVDRIPTYCEFAVPVSVPRRDGYQLVVDDQPAIPLTSNEGFLVAVVPS
ncbi:hypothetical protein GCM10022251_39190 [Phytohabitans flavus]|uniref:Lipoprotein n=1 Tax=Phytohabitans flavus TaxID=1076124 RepID=A0A6F8XVA0_9ACTN|nr:hypothetical protein [Phytohabitans flavus]BCB77756.1 hypothetical protein Pflav_041660 [Phytohabitans flavus]